MPKKSAAARSGAQRNKPRVQKSIELVRQTIEEKVPLEEKEVDTKTEVETQASDELTSTNASTAVALDTASENTKNESGKIANGTATRKRGAVQPATASVQGEDARAVSSTATASKGSAASRLAARRQATQKTQQRTAASLITAEHYAYVRRELVVIAILAFIMFAVIVILHFIPAIGG